MRKNVKVVALCTVLGIATVGCQKETFVLTQPTISETADVYNLSYSVAGTIGSCSIYGESDLDNFLRSMFALVKEGYRLNISNTSTRSISAKEVVVYTTYSEEEAINWSKDMIHQGYDVDITYDPKTGIYTCTASR